MIHIHPNMNFLNNPLPNFAKLKTLTYERADGGTHVYISSQRFGLANDVVAVVGGEEGIPKRHQLKQLQIADGCH
jgi:hypothetical protein